MAHVLEGYPPGHSRGGAQAVAFQRLTGTRSPVLAADGVGL
jgi:hypothetical protein